MKSTYTIFDATGKSHLVYGAGVHRSLIEKNKSGGTALSIKGSNDHFIYHTLCGMTIHRPGVSKPWPRIQNRECEACNAVIAKRGKER